MAQRGRNPAASMNRRTVESLKAQQEQARFALAATNITLSSNVAAAAIQEASLRAQIDATDELIKINTNMLEILRSQYAKGYASELDVAAQESQLAQMAATLPPLLKQLAQQRDLLTVLAGGFPDKDMAEKFELSSLQLPHELPLSLPSKLVEQRPDVRQAEENLHSASALIGVARANRLPSFNLTGDIGSMALAFGNIFSAGNGFRATGASVTQPIFRWWNSKASGASRPSGLCSGQRTIPQHSPHRISKCGRYAECTTTRCRRPKGCGGRERRSRRYSRSGKEAVSGRLRQLPGPIERGASVSTSCDYSCASPRQSLRRHCRVIPGTRRRVVEPPGCAAKLIGSRIDGCQARDFC